jgi:hypothetical protein
MALGGAFTVTPVTKRCHCSSPQTAACACCLSPLRLSRSPASLTLKQRNYQNLRRIGAVCFGHSLIASCPEPSCCDRRFYCFVSRL